LWSITAGASRCGWIPDLLPPGHIAERHVVVTRRRRRAEQPEVAAVAPGNTELAAMD
jgi:hypothetical protein